MASLYQWLKADIKERYAEIILTAVLIWWLWKMFTIPT